MKPLTILHTIETSGPGGAENVLLTIAKGLDPQRFRSIVAINDPGWLEDQLHELRLPCHRISWKHWYDLKLPRALARLVRSEGVDLIHSHLPDQNFYACLAGALSGCPTVATYHGPVEFKNSGNPRNALKIRLVKHQAAAVSVVCSCVEQMLIEMGFPPARVQRIPNGISSSKYVQAGDGRLRSELGVSPETPLVGMVANIRPTKGHEYFLRAAHLVLQRHPEAFFFVSGDGHDKLAPPLFQLAAELGVLDRVRFLGFRGDVPSLLAQMDVFVLPSTSEGFPLVVLEAMASGKAVVCTRCGGVEEMITDGEDGLAVPVGDAQALADNISLLLRNRIRAARLGENARRRVREQFSTEGMIASYERLYLQYARRSASTATLRNVEVC